MLTTPLLSPPSHGPEDIEFSLAALDLHLETVLPLILLVVAYLWVVRRAGRAEPVERRRAVLFLLGVAALAVALLPPLHDLSEGYLFSAHMVQHVLLTLVAAPLLLSGVPPWLARRLTAGRGAGPARVIFHPVVAFIAFNALFYLWHLPSLYDRAVGHDGIHLVEHTTMMAGAMLMWWPIVGLLPELHRLTEPLQMLYLFLVMVAQKPLFIFISLSRAVLYSAYVEAPRMWGLSPLEDQQLGGLLMVVSSMGILMGMLVVIFLRWYGREERENPPAIDSPAPAEAGRGVEGGR